MAYWVSSLIISDHPANWCVWQVFSSEYLFLQFFSVIFHKHHKRYFSFSLQTILQILVRDLKIKLCLQVFVFRAILFFEKVCCLMQSVDFVLIVCPVEKWLWKVSINTKISSSCWAWQHFTLLCGLIAIFLMGIRSSREIFEIKKCLVKRSKWLHSKALCRKQLVNYLIISLSVPVPHDTNYKKPIAQFADNNLMLHVTSIYVFCFQLQMWFVYWRRREIAYH